MSGMSRRGGSTVKYVLFVAFGLSSIYGLFSYHGISTQLKETESQLSKASQQQDSVSAQLNVVYEHKARLEKSLDAEKLEHKKTRESLSQRIEELDAQNEGEKSDLMSRISSIDQKNKMLEVRAEDQEIAYDKLREEMDNLRKANEKDHDEQNDEYLLMKQEKDNELGKLNDEIANWKRKYGALEVQFNDLKDKVLQQGQQNQQFQQQQAQFAQQQQHQQPMGNLQQQQQPMGNQQFQQQQQPQQQFHPIGNQQQFQQHQQPQPGFQSPLQQQQQGNQFQQPDTLGQFLQHAGDTLNQMGQNQPLKFQPRDQQQPIAVDIPQAPNADHEGAAQNANIMQINKPGDKPGYFEPKPADPAPNNVPLAAVVDEESENNGGHGGQVVNEQVVMPPANGQQKAVDVQEAGMADKQGEGFDFALRHRRDMADVYEEGGDDGGDDLADEEADDDAQDQDDGVGDYNDEDHEDHAQNVGQGFMQQQQQHQEPIRIQNDGAPDAGENAPILAPEGDNLAGNAADNVRQQEAEDNFDDRVVNDAQEDADARNSRLRMMNRLKNYIDDKGVFKPNPNDDLGFNPLEAQDRVEAPIGNGIQNDVHPNQGAIPNLEHDRLDNQQNGEEPNILDRPMLANGLAGGMGDDGDVLQVHAGEGVDDRNKDLFDDGDLNGDDHQFDNNFEMR